MQFSEKEGRARRVVFIRREPAQKGATSGNCPLRLHLPTAREGKGDGGRPIKQIPSTKIVPRKMMQPQRETPERPAMKPLK
jgi:hypothetical protein